MRLRLLKAHGDVWVIRRGVGCVAKRNQIAGQLAAYRERLALPADLQRFADEIVVDTSAGVKLRWRDRGRRTLKRWQAQDSVHNFSGKASGVEQANIGENDDRQAVVEKTPHKGGIARRAACVMC